jgi:FtsP/CotA-like multicopper oxidase with cupredoxin domain
MRRSLASNPGRREFLAGLAGAGVITGLGTWRPFPWGIARADEPQSKAGVPSALTIGETPVNFTGKPRLALTVNDSLPAPLLRWREGDTVTLRVANSLRETASIH